MHQHDSTSSRDIAFSMLVGPPDLPFYREVLAHQLKIFAGCFAEKIIVVDDLPQRNPAYAAAAPELVDSAGQLKAEGIVDTVVSLKAFHLKEKAALVRHFGRVPRWPRDFRGIPLAGWVAGMESSSTEWHFHADSDILFHVGDGQGWLARARQLMEQHDDYLICAPHPGPPTEQPLSGQQHPFAKDASGNLLFDSFSSRRFFVRKPRLHAMLPLPTQFVDSKRTVLQRLLRWQSPLLNWELLMTLQQRRQRLQRVHLPADSGWTLHAADHGKLFKELLPSIIHAVEAGKWPQQQEGEYDVALAAWEALLR